MIEGRPSEAALNALRRGVTISEDDGKRHTTAPARVRLLRHNGDTSWVALTIHEGHKRQIRRMFAAIGHNTLQLVRVGVGNLTLQGVPLGQWRYLNEAEMEGLDKGTPL